MAVVLNLRKYVMLLVRLIQIEKINKTWLEWLLVGQRCLQVAIGNLIQLIRRW